MAHLALTPKSVRRKSCRVTISTWNDRTLCDNDITIEMSQIAQATDTVLRLERHNAFALGKLLAMYGDILKIYPSLLKAGMQIVEVSNLHASDLQMNLLRQQQKLKS